ncbi:MAG: MinD/ParA family protein [Salinirussus sp.]
MLAIAGGKGGSGRTTTALGLAATLADRGREPLVVDGDCDMPDLHLLAGTDPDPGLDAVARGGSVEAVASRSPRFPGVAVLAAGTREGLRGTLDRLALRHGPVLVDCPSGVTEQLAHVLRASDRCVIVATDRPQAVEDGLKTAAVARELGTPPAAVAIRDADGRRAADAFDADTVRVPGAPEPFEDSRVRDAWRRLLGVLERSALQYSQNP